MNRFNFLLEHLAGWDGRQLHTLRTHLQEPNLSVALRPQALSRCKQVYTGCLFNDLYFGLPLRHILNETRKPVQGVISSALSPWATQGTLGDGEDTPLQFSHPRGKGAGALVY